MENYESTSIGYVTNKKVLMTHKEKYAKLFSEGRKSLEDLLLTCYNNDIITHACCSGHLTDHIEDSISYIFLKPNKKNLNIVSNIINEFKNSDLREISDIEESIKTFSPFRDYYGFIVRTYYETADEVYSRLIDIINNATKTNVSIEYEVLEYLKKELLKFRKKVLPKYSKDKLQASCVDIIQSGDLDSISNCLQIYSIDFQCFPIDEEHFIDLDVLTKYINDHDDVNYTDLICKYKYEDDQQLQELKKVLLKKNK